MLDPAMPDFATARRMMVDGQVRTSDVTDHRIIAAMLETPRERFVPERQAALSYLDLDLPLQEGPGGRRMLKPMVLAKLLQAAAIAPQDRVLDVACGTGYSSALLARLAGSVTAIEADAALAERARANLAMVPNVEVVTAPLADGWPAGAPYDVILLNGAAETLPRALIRQLGEGGRLVGIIGGTHAAKAVVCLNRGGQASVRPIFDATAPVLADFAEPATFVF